MVKKLIFLYLCLYSHILFAQSHDDAIISLTEKQSAHLTGIAKEQFGNFISRFESIDHESVKEFFNIFEKKEETGIGGFDDISKQGRKFIGDIYAIEHYVEKITNFEENKAATHFSTFEVLDHHKNYSTIVETAKYKKGVSSEGKYIFTIKFGFKYSYIDNATQKKIHQPLSQVECMFVVELPRKDGLIDFGGIYELKPEDLKIRQLQEYSTHSIHQKALVNFKQTKKLTLRVSKNTADKAGGEKVLQTLCNNAPSQDTPYNSHIIDQKDRTKPPVIDKDTIKSPEPDTIKREIEQQEEPKKDEKTIELQDDEEDSLKVSKPILSDILVQIQSLMPIYVEGYRIIGEKDSSDFQKERTKNYLLNMHQYNKKVKVEAAIIPRVTKNSLVNYLDLLQELDYDQVELSHKFKTQLSPNDLAIISNHSKNELSKKVALSLKKAKQLASLQPVLKDKSKKMSTAGIKVAHVDDETEEEESQESGEYDEETLKAVDQYIIHVWYSWSFLGIKFEKERRKHRKHTGLSFKEAQFIVKKEQDAQGHYYWKVYMGNTRVLYAQRDITTNPF